MVAQLNIEVETAAAVFSYLLETVDVVSSEEAVKINGMLSTSGYCAHVFFALAYHGPLQ